MNPSEDLADTYSMSRTCEVCSNSASSSPRRPCQHVVCNRCDIGFKKVYPDHECGLCELRSTPSGEHSEYARPVPQPRRPQVTRRGSVNDTCDSCGSAQPTDTYCESCKHICQSCVRQHKTMAVLKNHILVMRTSLPKIPPQPNAPEEKTQLDVSTPTFEEFSKQADSLLSSVNQKSTTLINLIDKTDQDVQAHTKITVQEIMKRAEQMKKDIDEDVRKQTERLSAEQRALLTSLRKRKEFITLQARKISNDLRQAREEANACRDRLNKQSLDDDGYTQMAQFHEMTRKRGILGKKLEDVDRLFQELTFDYHPPSKPDEGLGKLKSVRRIQIVAETRVQRFESEDSYIATAMQAAPVDCILFTSCKGADKAAADLVNIHGNALHTRKLQDKGQNPLHTPAFAALIDGGIAVIGWETSIFSMKIATRNEVDSFSVREFLVPGANVCCLTVDNNNKRIMFGNNKNRIINTINFQMKHVSSLTLKEECSPPTSIAAWNANLLVTDGVEAAFLSDPRGNTIARFINPPVNSNLKPIAVDSCGETAYVLWITRSTPPTTPAAYVQSYDLSDTSGGLVGNCLRVPDDTRFIAAISLMDDDDRLVAGTPSGNLSIYCVQEM